MTKRVEISSEKIQKRIVEVAPLLNKQFQGKTPVIISILKGSICLTADLIRHLDFSFQLEFIRCQSYGARGAQSGTLTIEGVEALSLQGRDLLLIDDILDTGQTLDEVVKSLSEKKPASLTTLVLLAKKGTRRKECEADIVLFEIEDHFVVGYGLDYKEEYRGLPSICTIESLHS